MNRISLSDCGRQRSNNEDAYANRGYDSFELSVIADGMGGHLAGEVASKMATEAVLAYFDREQKRTDYPRMAGEAVEEANRLLYEKQSKDPTVSGMGTTADVVVVEGSTLHLAHVGDSRVYLLRDACLRQVTADHSLVGDLIRRGLLTEQDAKSHPDRSVVTRALGAAPQVEVDLLSIPLRDKDRILLCTDGLSNMVDDEEIRSVLMEFESLALCAEQLVARANGHGGADNITLTIFEYRSEEWNK